MERMKRVLRIFRKMERTREKGNEKERGRELERGREWKRETEKENKPNVPRKYNRKIVIFCKFYEKFYIIIQLSNQILSAWLIVIGEKIQGDLWILFLSNLNLTKPKISIRSRIHLTLFSNKKYGAGGVLSAQRARHGIVPFFC